MDPWSNIDTSPQDTEIAEINNFENTLGDIPSTVRKIRELITRFEICHFKCQRHIKNIQDSILSLEPATDSNKIGSNHISKGENAWTKDKTGRSQIGQQYLLALKKWLATTDQGKMPKGHEKKLELEITTWLGDKIPDKERIVRLLIARLTYDWESYEKLQLGGQFKDLEYQTCRMDICHYAFPDHLDNLIQAIGKMQPHKDLEGCGSYNSEIKTFAEGKYSEICLTICNISKSSNLLNQSKNDLFRTWLYLCLAKTIKGQIGITDSLPRLDK